MVIGTTILGGCYRLIGNLLLYPDERDANVIERLRRRVEGAPDEILHLIDAFMADPASASIDEYVQTIELSPPCPPYLGVYLFDEPTTCRDVGYSGRNAYMLDLTGIYRHFGFEPLGNELPDYVPLVVDFLWISLEHRDRDSIGLRRTFVESYVKPAIGPALERLERYGSPYALLVQALGILITADIEAMSDVVPWEPPAPAGHRRRAPLPVLETRPHTEDLREEMKL